MAHYDCSWKAERAARRGARDSGLRRRVNCLAWADDLAVVTQSKEEMEQALGLVRRWGKDNGLELNAAKSKVIVFGEGKWLKLGWCEGRKGCKCHFRMGPEYLERVRHHKYLGVVMEP